MRGPQQGLTTMSSNQRLFDRQIEHMIRSRLHQDEMLELLQRLGSEHSTRLTRLFGGREEQEILDEVRRYGISLTSRVRDSLTDYLSAELDFQYGSVNREVGSFYRLRTPERGYIAARLLEEPMRFGNSTEPVPSVSASINRLTTAHRNRVNYLVREAIAQGMTQEQVEQRLQRSARLSAQQARTVAVTGFTHADSLVRDEFWNENSDLLAGYTYTAILDASTTRLCSSLDGTFEPAGAVKHRPPLHWNCRSSLVPVLRSVSQLRELATDRLDQDELATVPTTLLNGSPAERENFEAWLRRQTFEKQREMLNSEERVTLFQRGALRISEFWSNAQRPMSLAALRRQDALSTFRHSRDQPTSNITIAAARPSQLVRSTELRRQLEQLIYKDVQDSKQSITLTDYRGTSLPGKRESRRRSTNEFDERNNSFDPFSGEQRSTYYYDPDYTVYTERLDTLSRSQVLSQAQRDWIREFVEGLNDNVSTNQRSVILETLRVTFERAARDGAVDWEDYARVFRAETNYSVVNISRILDRRSRANSELFIQFGSPGESPRAQIMGRWTTFEELLDRKLANQNFVRDWDKTYGRAAARRLYTGNLRVVLRALFTEATPKPKGPPKSFVRWIEKNIPGISSVSYGELKLSNWLAGIVADLPGVKQLRDFITWWETPQAPLLQRWRRTAEESIQNIIDLQFLRLKERRTLVDRLALSPLLDDDSQLRVLQSMLKTIATGMVTDYDGLAITLGDQFFKANQPFRPWYKPTLQDKHREGSRILSTLRDQGTIRIVSRGVNRRAVLDLETGRQGGNWQDTVSREVTILDEDLLTLQRAQRELILADRIGVTSETNRYYVKPGHTTYFDSRGNNTGVPIITRSAFPFVEENFIDNDFANMLNHTMSTQFTVDRDFASFFLDLARFRDVRGRSEYYDSINLFRHEITNRGEMGYGLIETLRFHLERGKPFSVHARIDGRGRVYYNGYLTPTGGEVVRPFLNSANSYAMTPGALNQIRASLGTLVGESLEVLTDQGRLDAFRRHEADFLRIGELISSTTQRDRRLREFMELPLVRNLDGEEVAKLARFSLEYYRIHQHTRGQVDNPLRLSTYRTQLMGEIDASASALQMISLATGDRRGAALSNVVPTQRKQRIYDIVAQRTASDPRFLRLMEDAGLDLSWEDLQKAAKYQVMIALYGAGRAGQAFRVTEELAKVLGKRDIQFVTRREQLAINKLIDQRIRQAQEMGAEDVVEQLRSFKSEVSDVVRSRREPTAALFAEAEEFHPDVFNFLQRATARQGGYAGPDLFREIAKIMSEKLAEAAPSAQNYITFWKRVGQAYAENTGRVDLPWVTFDGKVVWQRYRPRVEKEIRFFDPETGRYVRNIYAQTSDKDELLGRGSIGDIRLGTGVNGTHANDASIVRQFHLWGRRNSIPTTTIHDAFFTSITHLDTVSETILAIYADAAGSRQIERTLEAMRSAGLPREVYERFLEEARELGMVGNPLTKEEILRDLRPGESRYGLGP